jgi:YD repeat-containing protein
VSTVGSSLTRIDKDGSEAVYAWDAASTSYRSTAGAGAYDSIKVVGTQYVWSDGDSGLSETYESAATGRLLSAADKNGNIVSYAYDAANNLKSMTSANGEVTYFDYVGNNLSQVRTVTGSGATAVTLTRVRYSYDTSNRLVTVTVDLSPEDNAITDARVYTASYSYDGTSKRVASLSQSDGSRLDFTYVLIGAADYRIASVKDGLNQITNYTYDSLYEYDTAGQLTKITAPVIGGVSQISSFAYNANGDLTLVTDAEGRTVTMTYDANGNQTLQRDAAGNTVTRSYDVRNQLLTETVYLTPDPDGAGALTPGTPQVTRYVYDAAGKNLLRFVLSPEGRVTEYRYNGFGQRINSYQFESLTYATGALAPTAVPTEAELAAWVAAQSANGAAAAAQRTNFTYDARGQLASTAAYNSNSASGMTLSGGKATKTGGLNGIWDSSVRSTTGYTGASEVSFVAAQTNKLLMVGLNTDPAVNNSFSSIDWALYLTSSGALLAYENGVNVTPAGLGSYVVGDVLKVSYDGIKVRYWKNGVVLREVAAVITQPLYADSSFLTSGAQVTGLTFGNTTGGTSTFINDNATSTWDGGATTTYVYDQAGQLLKTISGTAGATVYTYDGLGRVLSTQNALLQTTLNSYDDANNKTTLTLANGLSSTSAYDKAGRLLSLQHSSAQTANLGVTQYFYDVNGRLRMSQDPTGVRNWMLYDEAGRKVADIDGNGSLTEYLYNKNNQLTQTIAYATAVNVASLVDAAGKPTNPTLASIRVANAADRKSWNAYDNTRRLARPRF